MMTMEELEQKTAKDVKKCERETKVVFGAQRRRA